MIEMTVGCDPEVFLQRAGSIIPSIGRVGGTKKNPKQIEKNVWVQEDNVTVEFNISPVKFESPISLREATRVGLTTLRDYLRSLDSGYTVQITPEADLGKQIESLKEAWVFGCDPDLDAYSHGAGNYLPEIEDTWRYAGGHIHIGYDVSATTIPKFALVMIGEWATLGKMTQGRSLSGSRRGDLYGKAGSYRDKPYGFEYRTASNSWLRGDHVGYNPADIFTHAVYWAMNNPSKAQAFFNKVLSLYPKVSLSELRVHMICACASGYASPSLMALADEYIKL